MKKRQILYAIVFGSMLAITGCGDSEDGDGGNPGSGGSAGSSGTAGSGGSPATGGSGGSGSGDFCSIICQNCAGGEAECLQACEGGIIPGELNDCPTEADALGTCLAANDCSGEFCQTEWTTWFTCLVTPQF